MLRFKVSTRGGGSVESLYYECECGVINIRGLVACVDIRPFICWSCGKKLPNIMGMLKNKWMRVQYHKEGNEFQSEQV